MKPSLPLHWKLSASVAALSLVICNSAAAQALPNFVGNALAQGITQNLVTRGFAANDPRIASTIEAVGSDAAAVAAESGAGGTWLGAMAELNPYALAGVAVGAGLIWYFNSTGLTYLAPPGSVTSVPVFSNGTTAGGTCWAISGGGCFGSPQESLSYLFYQTELQYPTASYGVPSLVQNSATQYTATYNYSIPPLYLTNASGSKVITQAQATITCAAGSGYVSGKTGCQSAGLATSPWANSPVVGTTLQAADAALPASVQSAAMTPDLAAELLNRVWQDAASKPNYAGVPWSATSPAVDANFTGYQAANPTAWPLTSDLQDTLPSTNPIPAAANANQSNPAASTTQVNLGADPGTPQPTLDAAPSGLMQPIQNLMSGWLSWTVPAHQGVCPTWSAAPTIAGTTFSINLTYQCTVAEQWRSAISTIALIVWLVTAAFIVLAA